MKYQVQTALNFKTTIPSADNIGGCQLRSVFIVETCKLCAALGSA